MLDPYLLTKEEERHFSGEPKGFAPCPVCGEAPKLSVVRGLYWFKGLWSIHVRHCGIDMGQVLVSKGHTFPEGRLKAIRAAEHVLREWWNMNAERLRARKETPQEHNEEI